LLYIQKRDIKAAQVKEKDIKAYIMDLKMRNVSNSTINRRNTALRLYFKYLRKQGVMMTNPYEDIKQLNLNKREQNISADDIKKVEDFIIERGNKRDTLLFFLSYYEKLKMPEIITLKKENYHEIQGILYTNKRAVLVSDKTKALIKEFIQQGNNEYLLVNQHNRTLTESGGYYILKNYFKETGIESLRPIDLTKIQI
jgi:site-specific recombinase XerD